MSHGCFVSYKKEDKQYMEAITEKLRSLGICVKSLDKTIDSDDLDYVIQYLREHYLQGTSVTLYLIGEHSSENEGIDQNGRNHQSFIIRELKATLYDGDGDRRSGLLGIVLPMMETRIYGGTRKCPLCGKETETIHINDETVLREFSQNYWLDKGECNHYTENGRYCVLVRYSEFMKDPEKYINRAFDKTNSDICKKVHYKDIKHQGF